LRGRPAVVIMKQCEWCGGLNLPSASCLWCYGLRKQGAAAARYLASLIDPDVRNP